MQVWRRTLLISSAALAAAACTRVAPRPAAPPVVTPPPDFERWNQEARGILSDGLQTLRVFDTFQAFRATTAAQSDIRLAAELAWDPPTSAAWDEATHVTRGLHGRAEQLFQSVTTTRIDVSLWREQRRLGDATQDLLELGDRLGAYRQRIDILPPGDAADALGLLNEAWTQWDTAAARWGAARGEPIDCVSFAA